MMKCRDERQYIKKIEAQLVFPEFDVSQRIKLDWRMKYCQQYSHKPYPEDELDEKSSRVYIKVHGYYVDGADLSRTSISVANLTIPAVQAKIDAVADKLRQRIKGRKKREFEEKNLHKRASQILESKGVREVRMNRGHISFNHKGARYEGRINTVNGDLRITITAKKYTPPVSIDEVI